MSTPRYDQAIVIETDLVVGPDPLVLSRILDKLAELSD